MKASEIKKLGYDEAKEKLQLILNDLESNDISLEKIEQHVKDAKALIEHCEQKLLSSQKAIEDLLDN